MPLTRLESAGQVDTLLEDLKNSSGFCIIHKETLELILRDNITLHTATHQLNVRMTESIEKLNTLYATNAIEQSAARNDLNERLDTLIEKISTNNLLPSQEQFDLDSQLKKRKEAIEKLTRNQELSKYYEELLNEPESYVRPEFRTRVNTTTTERELVHRRQQAIERVRTEIKVMEDRVADWTEKKNYIDHVIEEFLKGNEDQRTEVEQKLATQSRVIKETFDRTTMAKLKKTDDDEKMKSFEYLIKTTDNDSLNYRGQSSRSRRRGRSRNAQHEY